MITYKFIHFNQNIIDSILQSALQDKTIIIFPSNNSRNLAMDSLQKIWAFQDISLITMDDLSDLTSLSEKPHIQDTKRYLLFYKSLNQKLKEKYNITDFFTSKLFCEQFIKLFTEFNDEHIDIQMIEEKLISQGFFADWQHEMWLDLVQMYGDYSSYLKPMAFDDLIFHKPNYQAVTHFFSEYKHIIFANQFYFTESEKKLIRYLNGSKNITLFFQFPEIIFDKNTFSVKDFSLKDLLKDAQYESRKICLYASPTDFAQLNKMVEIIDREHITNIVDYDFYEHSWFKLLSNEKFSLPQSYSFENSELFQFFKTMLNLLDSMQYVQPKKKFLFPLAEVFNAFNFPYFRDYFICANYPIDNEHCVVPNTELDLFFRKLAQNGYLYFDPYNLSSMLKYTESEAITTGMTEFANLIKSIIEIKQMNQFIDFIDAESGIDIKQIANAEAIEKTDLLEKFYETLSNIYTIEEFGIVSDWKEIFPYKLNQPIIIPILRFFIEYIKPTKISFETTTQGKVHFLTLVDTRNLKYDKILFLNVTEGVLPKAKSVDFLFNEKQRKIIGLKTYEEIRLREKYYFYRIVLSSLESHIFYTENEDDNIDKSSFIEELQVYMHDKIEHHECKDKGYIDFYSTHVKSIYCDDKKLNNLDFYLIPSDFEKDFAEPYTINLNTYSFLELLKDPMQWFIESNLKFKQFIYPIQDRLNALIIGNVIHKYLENIYNSLNKLPTKEGRKSINSNGVFSPVNDITMGQFKAALKDENLNFIYEQFLYKYPHDFSGKYFESILFPYIKSSLQSLFYDGELSKLKDEAILQSEVELPKQLFLDTPDYKVYISGRLDMMIGDCVVDFKTGAGNMKQLYLYEWLLKQNNCLEYNIFFFDVFTQTVRKIPKTRKITIEDLQNDLKETLDNCLKFGYFYPRSRTDRQEYQDISRINILRQDKPDFWTSAVSPSESGINGEED